MKKKKKGMRFKITSQSLTGLYGLNGALGIAGAARSDAADLTAVGTIVRNSMASGNLRSIKFSILYFSLTSTVWTFFFTIFGYLNERRELTMVCKVTLLILQHEIRK